jgi:hypothetical protein
MKVAAGWRRHSKDIFDFSTITEGYGGLEKLFQKNSFGFSTPATVASRKFSENLHQSALLLQERQTPPIRICLEQVMHPDRKAQRWKGSTGSVPSFILRIILNIANNGGSTGAKLTVSYLA